MPDPLTVAMQKLAAGDLAAARDLCQQVTQAWPNHGEAWYVLGRVEHAAKQRRAAIQAMRRAVSLAPADPNIVMPAAEVLRLAGDIASAIEAGRRATQAMPQHPAPWNNLGLALDDHGDAAQAERCFLHAIELDRHYHRAHLNLGNVYTRQHRFADADRAYRSALAIKPDYVAALNAFGKLCIDRHDDRTAHAHLQEALRIQPDYRPAKLNLANALTHLDRQADAEALFRQLVEQHPDYAQAWHDLGALCEKVKRTTDALAAYERYLALSPDDPRAHTAVLNVRRSLCDWRGWPDDVDRMIDITRTEMAADRPSPLWPLSSCRFPTTNADRLAIARQHADQIARHIPPEWCGAVKLRQAAPALLAGAPIADQPPIPRNDKLRVGFLSHEFIHNVVGHLMAGLFERFDRDRFEVFAFDYSKPDGSDIRRRIHAGCDHVCHLTNYNTAQQAAAIARQHVHILFDINAYMPGGRPEIAAHRPAPIQVSHMYPATTGAPWIDYFITDHFVTPPGHEQWFTEKLVYLPDCYLPTDGDQAIAPPDDQHVPSRAECGLPDHVCGKGGRRGTSGGGASGGGASGAGTSGGGDGGGGGFVFASFNKSDKIDPALFGVWMRILAAVPGSVLWQREDQPTAQANLRREAEARGVAGDRIIFAPALQRIDLHLARHRYADLFLDTYIHGGHGTAVDALWAGLPVLTCPGDTFASRVAGSLLHTLGHDALIADSLATYESLAIALATTDRPRLDAFAADLAARRHTSPAFDTTRYVRHLERALLHITEHATPPDLAC